MDKHRLFSISLFFSFIVSFIIPTTLAKWDTYIVHMDLSLMPKAFSTHHNWYLSTLDYVSDKQPKLRTSYTTPSSVSPHKLIYSYKNVIHGFSASLSPSELEALKNTLGYVSSMRDVPVKADTTYSSKFLGLNSDAGAWPVSNYGRDVIIGVIDTGVWPESPSFNDAGMTEIPSRWRGECQIGTQFNTSMCNKKLIGAKYFNKGLMAKYPNVSIPMNSTRDTEGHGTHTSSTAAGNYADDASYFSYASGTATGIAPRARVAMYKALWDTGAFSSDIMAAIDQAIIDGVDIISLSLGLSGVPLYQDPVAIATFAAIEKGIFVSTSAGNEGPYLETLHNGTPWVLTVAAGSVDRTFGGIISLGDGSNQVLVTGMSLYPGNSSVLGVPAVFMDACDDLRELRKVGRKIVVCQDNQTMQEQVDNIQHAGVAGGIFISNNTDLEFFIQVSFPAMFINLNDGEIVKNYIKDNSGAKASLEFKRTFFGAKPAPRVSSYSSRGPSPSCPFVLKPDVLAPGASILAAWPAKTLVIDFNSRALYGNFNILSGTSMACPHATGVAALLKAAHPEWSPAAIRSAMMTTSTILDNTLGPITDIGQVNEVASPLAMGAGHIDPNKALDPGLIYEVVLEDYVNLICAMNFTKNQTQTIIRSSTYDCSTPSLDLNYPSFIGFFNQSKSNAQIVQEFRRIVTNVGGGTSNYTATLTPMNGFEVSVEPNKLMFKEKNEKQSYTLRVKSTKFMEDAVVFGYLSWIDSEAKHVVRSPIVATSSSSVASLKSRTKENSLI